MLKAGSRIFAMVACLAALATPALAVTVDVDVVSNGEPVPGATVSFETETGVVVPPEPPPAPSTQQAGKLADGTVPPATVSTVLPDEMLGKPLTAVISKDGKVVKRHQVTVTDKETRVSVEAYDPADAALSINIDRPESCDSKTGCDLSVAIANDGTGIYEGPIFITLKLPGLDKEDFAASGSWLDCAEKKGGGWLCRLDVSIEPLKHVTVALPLHPAAGQALPSGACVSLLAIDAASERSTSLMMALQLGLVLQGAQLGAIDGKGGPRTASATAALGLPSDVKPETLLNEAFGKLFSKDAIALSRLGIDGREACVSLRRGTVSTKNKPPKSSSSTTARKKTSTGQAPKEKPKPKTKTSKSSKPSKGGIGVDVEIGIGVDLLKHKKKHKSDDEYED